MASTSCSIVGCANQLDAADEAEEIKSSLQNISSASSDHDGAQRTWNFGRTSLELDEHLGVVFAEVKLAKLLAKAKLC